MNKSVTPRKKSIRRAARLAANAECALAAQVFEATITSSNVHELRLLEHIQ